MNFQNEISIVNVWSYPSPFDLSTLFGSTSQFDLSTPISSTFFFNLPTYVGSSSPFSLPTIVNLIFLHLLCQLICFGHLTHLPLSWLSSLVFLFLVNSNEITSLLIWNQYDFVFPMINSWIFYSSLTTS
jgi:hypothetical protein